MPNELDQSGEAAESGFSDKPVGGAKQPCPLAKKPKTWVKVQLVDDQGKALPGVPYRIELADGSIREGKLNGQGIVVLDEIEGAVCKVSFPTPE